MHESGRCGICPRYCLNGRENGGIGYCGAGKGIVIARAAPHYWEEPCISGTRGSGTVFFSGCNLKCKYCQNYEISSCLYGKKTNVDGLKEIIRNLKETGVHNINLVTPTHYVPEICLALEETVGIPVVYNSGGYENVETLKALEGKIDIYLPDMKYSDNRLAQKMSGAPNYFEISAKAIKEMARQTGGYEMNDEGLIQRGLIVRHLVLPGYIENTKGVLRWFADNFVGRHVKLSLMAQYTPPENAEAVGAPAGRVDAEEYREVLEYAKELGIYDGYFQEPSSAKSEYVPPFDLTGV